MSKRATVLTLVLGLLAAGVGAAGAFGASIPLVGEAIPLIGESRSAQVQSPDASSPDASSPVAFSVEDPSGGAGQAHDHSTHDHGPEGTPAEDRARGLVFDGLVPGRAGGPCAGAFELPDVAPDVCTHGPDPVPEGVDVAAEPSATTGTEPTTAAACDGDGVSGFRTHVIYAVASDRADRYSQFASSIRTWAAGVDSIVTQSAAATGGDLRLRWVNNASCEIVVDRVVLPTTADDTFSGTITAMNSAGYSRTDRKYLVFVDANVYCGIAQLFGDDSAGATNLNNGGRAMYARVDAGCWNAPTAAHELFHNLGAVQSSAPNSSGLGHCVDEYDLMCYADGTSIALRYSCPSSWSYLLDCGHDDYFHSSPATGSYLATRWNTARSAFLIAGAAPPPPTTTTTVTTSTTTTSAPPTSTTAPPPTSTSTSTTTTSAPPTNAWTFTGNLGRNSPPVAFTVNPSTAGQLQVRLDEGVLAPRGNGGGGGGSGSSRSWTIEVRTSTGTVVGSASGPSGTVVTTGVASGTYSVVVSGGRGDFTVSVTLQPGG